MNEVEVIIGIHSIAEAIKNPNRNKYKLYFTDEGLKELKNHINGKLDIDQKRESTHSLQEVAKKIHKENDLNYQRIPNGLMLVAEPTPVHDLTWLYENIESKEEVKVICLDQVTDGHNAGAILRTAAFYGVDAVLIATKGNFGVRPGMSRISSGALEYVPLVKCSSLPKALSKLADKGLTVIGFSEHAEVDVEKSEKYQKTCLVLGAEDVGLSNAVQRVLTHKVAFKPKGQIKSLNVSVASAIAMHKFF